MVDNTVIMLNITENDIKHFTCQAVGDISILLKQSNFDLV
jgi:hypothetical protein